MEVRSRRSTSRTPASARWKAVLAPNTPPPITTTRAFLGIIASASDRPEHAAGAQRQFTRARRGTLWISTNLTGSPAEELTPEQAGPVEGGGTRVRGSYSGGWNARFSSSAETWRSSAV